MNYNLTRLGMGGIILKYTTILNYNPPHLRMGGIILMWDDIYILAG